MALDGFADWFRQLDRDEQTGHVRHVDNSC